MANSQFNSREIIVGTGVTTPSETTLATFKSTATAGEIGVFSKDGGTLAAGDDFVVAVKTSDAVIVSDVIKASSASVVAKATAAAQEKKTQISGITIPSTTGATAEYIANIKLYNYGSLSIENFYTKLGHYVLTKAASSTAETVVDGLISNLNKSFSKEPGATATTNPLFTFSKGFTTYVGSVGTTADTSGNVTVTINGVDIVVALTDSDADTVDATKIAAGIDGTTIGGTTATASADGTDVTITLTDGTAIESISIADTGSTNLVFTFAETASTAALVITAVAQAQELGKSEGRQIQFDVTFQPESPYVGTVYTSRAANPGVGTGKEIANLEFFYRGAKGDAFRGVGYPYTWPTSTKTLASTSTSYDIIEVKHSKTGDGFNTVIMPKSLLIACPNNATNDVADFVIGKLETVTGLTIADLS